MRNVVIGQTGRIPLSEEAIQHKLGRKRTVRYQYQRTKHGWIAWVCGPFHSRTYGACAFGTDKIRSKAALQRRLANDYRYLDHMLYSDVDDADNVGNVDERLLDPQATARPLIFADLVGATGM
jgi:hypothetical protein